uniref:Dynein light chain roadblock n=1 Tax=Spermatozopsis similis TaxID=3192 RepID=Q9SM42_SPESI|nr:putative bithoraxoid-like protein [Spermatozopsis similis]
MAEAIQATLERIQKHKGVLGTIIIDHNGVTLHSTLDDKTTAEYTELIPALSMLAKNLVRDVDPQNDLDFLRVRSLKHEIMVAPKEEFLLIVIQDPAAVSA